MDDTVGRRFTWRRPEPAAAPQPAKPPERSDAYNAYADDPALMACLDPVLDDQAEDELRALGTFWGSSDAKEIARLAVAAGQPLVREDPYGNRIDSFDIHPAFRALLKRGVAEGLPSAAWSDSDDRRLHRLRAARLYMTAQCERGHLLPLCGTHAAVAALVYAPNLEGELFPLIEGRVYDPFELASADKEGILITLATAGHSPTNGPASGLRADPAGGDRLRVSGIAPFVPSPTADFFFVIAQSLDGPTAALVPRYGGDNDGTIFVDGVTEPVGMRSQAFASIRFEGAMARRVGDPGRGLSVLRDVRTLSELDTTIIAAGTARGAVVGLYETLRERRSDDRAPLAEPEVMQSLAGMAMDVAALTALALRLAGAFDQAFERDSDHAIARIGTPAARVYALGIAQRIALEAAELIGPVTLRASHPAALAAADLATLAHWDGSASGAATELAGLVARDPQLLRDCLDEVAAELGSAGDSVVQQIEALGEDTAGDVYFAHRFAEQLAMLIAVTTMRRHLPRVVGDAFLANRLEGIYGHSAGAVQFEDPREVIELLLPDF